jgi:hypothetical protein
MWHDIIRGPGRWFFTQRVVTAFGDKEFAVILAFCKRKKLSAYALAKKAIREYMERHP